MFHEKCLNDAKNTGMVTCPLCRTTITPSSSLINSSSGSTNRGGSMVSLTQGTSYMTARRMLQLHFSPGNPVFVSEDF
jgi:hypothetical protein